MKKHIGIGRVVLALNILGYVFLFGGIVISAIIFIKGGGNFGMGIIVSIMTFLLWGLTASLLAFFLSKFLQLFASMSGKHDAGADTKI